MIYVPDKMSGIKPAVMQVLRDLRHAPAFIAALGSVLVCLLPLLLLAGA